MIGKIAAGEIEDVIAKIDELAPAPAKQGLTKYVPDDMLPTFNGRGIWDL